MNFNYKLLPSPEMFQRNKSCKSCPFAPFLGGASFRKSYTESASDCLVSLESISPAYRDLFPLFNMVYNFTHLQPLLITTKLKGTEAKWHLQSHGSSFQCLSVFPTVSRPVLPCFSTEMPDFKYFSPTFLFFSWSKEHVNLTGWLPNLKWLEAVDINGLWNA